MPTGWPVNASFVVYKPQSHSNMCTQHRVTSISMVKVLHTGVEIMVTENQTVVFRETGIQ